MEFGTVDRVEMVLYEDHSLVHKYITESPDRIILATWGASVYTLTFWCPQMEVNISSSKPQTCLSFPYLCTL